MESLLRLLNTPEPPHLTMKARPGTRSVAELTREMDAALKPLENRELVKAAMFLWHDHFKAAHEIAQGIDNADGSLLHGILHRREPDYMNARYWFRRVPSHPSFDCLLRNATAADLPRDKWNPLAFVDFVEDSLRRKDAANEKIAREIQAAEIRCFLERLPAS